MSKPPEGTDRYARGGCCGDFPAYHDGPNGECRAWKPDAPGGRCPCPGWKDPGPKPPPKLDADGFEVEEDV